MAIIKCPECGNNVSEKAAACPHCGYGVAEHSLHGGQSIAPTIKCASCSGSISSLSTTCQYCGSHVAPSPELSRTLATENEFKDAAVKIVDTCEQALNLPRMMMNSLIAEARNQLDRLVVRHRHFLFAPKYDKVYPYLFACISRIEAARSQDNHASGAHGYGGVVGEVLGYIEDRATDEEVDYAKAYIRDLRVILGVKLGSPTAVRDLEDRDKRDSGGTCDTDCKLPPNCRRTKPEVPG